MQKIRSDGRESADLERFSALIKLLPEEPLPPAFLEDVRRNIPRAEPPRRNVWWTAPMRFLYAAASAAVVLFVVTSPREHPRQSLETSGDVLRETVPTAEPTEAPVAPARRAPASAVQRTQVLTAALPAGGFVLRGRTAPERRGDVLLEHSGTASGVATAQAVAVASPEEFAAFRRRYPHVAVPDGWDVDFETTVLVAAFLGRQPAGLRHAVESVVFGRREVTLQVTTSGYPAARAGHGATQETPYIVLVVER